MPLLNILQFPDPRLKLQSKPVTEITPQIQALVSDMFETLYSAPNNVGLAAIQVNVPQQIIVIDVSDDRTQPLCLINPEIISQQGKLVWEEGCLSFPGVYAKVERAREIELSYLDQHNHPHTLIATDLLGVCIQHEIDHLNGIHFYDHLSPLKQHMVKKKLEKIRKKPMSIE